MIIRPPVPSKWQPDHVFFISHFYLPLLISILLLVMMEISSIDLWLADRWYAIEGGDWSLRNHWLTYDVIHHHGKQMIIAFALGLIAVLLTSFKVGHLRIWRQPVAYVLTSIVLLPSLAASLKKINTVVCPAELMRYGGELAYRHNFEYEFTLDAAGHCFPSGHASGGFALIALYFASLGYSNRPWRFALPGIFIGIIFALGQQARGQHFLSHDLWTVTICWFGALALFVVFRPYQMQWKKT